MKSLTESHLTATDYEWTGLCKKFCGEIAKVPAELQELQLHLKRIRSHHRHWLIPNDVLKSICCKHGFNSFFGGGSAYISFNYGDYIVDVDECGDVSWHGSYGQAVLTRREK